MAKVDIKHAYRIVRRLLFTLHEMARPLLR